MRNGTNDDKPLNAIFGSMADKHKGELYLKLVNGIIGLYNGDACDAGFDNVEIKEIYVELSNVVDALRRNWEQI